MIRGPLADRRAAICAAWRTLGAEKNSRAARELIGRLAAKYGVQRPAIWKVLRTGGVLPPYRPSGKAESTAIDLPPNLPLVPETLPPERFSCFLCGVRSDLGCRHHPRTEIVF